MSIRLPSRQNRTAIVGTTGSGKTQFAVWLLSTRDFDDRPWFILDYKSDALIGEIGATKMRITDKLPRKPGLYRIFLVPSVDDAAVDDFFWRCLYHRRLGIYIDEGYMLPKEPGRYSKGLLAVLTQGRSKNIEMIVLAQRPVRLPSKYILTEAQFFAFFNLTNKGDKKYLNDYAEGYDPNKRLPKYHSTWYDVERQEEATLGPVPDRQTLISTIRQKLGHKVRRI